MRASHFADEARARILQFDATTIHRTVATKVGALGAPSDAARVCRVHVDVPTSRARSLQAHRIAEVLAAGRRGEVFCVGRGGLEGGAV